jgi:hypothetical protein
MVLSYIHAGLPGAFLVRRRSCKDRDILIGLPFLSGARSVGKPLAGFEQSRTEQMEKISLIVHVLARTEQTNCPQCKKRLK